MPSPSGILTPEAVLLDFQEAGLASRGLAFAIDLLGRLAVVYVFALGFTLIGASGGTTLAYIGIAALLFGVILLYPMLFETFWNGRTPGKAALGLRVVTVEGAPVGLRHAAIRASIAIVDLLVCLGALAIVAALGTRRGQRLGDLAAGTMVVRERRAAGHAGATTFQPPPGWESFAALLDVSALGPEHYALVRSFLLRAWELTPDARVVEGSAIAESLAERLGTPLPPSADRRSFLIAVCAAYQQRATRLEPTPSQPQPDDSWRTPLPAGWGLPADTGY